MKWAYLLMGLWAGGIMGAMLTYWLTRAKPEPEEVITKVELIIGPQANGTLSLQLNLNDKPSGWIAIDDNVRAYITRRLEETKGTP